MATSNETPTEKACSHCHEVKPLEAFSPAKKGRLGRASYCRLCTNARYRDTEEKAHRTQARAKARAAAAALFARGLKHCSQCHEEKPLDAFSPIVGSRHGLHAHCKRCKSAKAVKTANRTILKEQQRAANELLEQGLRRCKQCEQTKPLDAFTPQARGGAGRHSRCRACVNANNADAAVAKRAQLLARIKELEDRLRTAGLDAE